AGILTNDMERLTRAERNLDRLLAERPAAKPGLLAWKAGIALYYAVVAHEQKRQEEFDRQYQLALDLFSEANRLAPSDGGVAAITGGSLLIFGDRLPQSVRAAAYVRAYDSYSELWKQQGAGVEKLPLHLKGELLSGLAQSAQRSGRAEETARLLDQIVTLLPNT